MYHLAIYANSLPTPYYRTFLLSHVLKISDDSLVPWEEISFRQCGSLLEIEWDILDLWQKWMCINYGMQICTHLKIVLCPWLSYEQLKKKLCLPSSALGRCVLLCPKATWEVFLEGLQIQVHIWLVIALGALAVILGWRSVLRF